MVKAEQQQQDKVFLTTRQVAEIVGVTVPYIRQLLIAGRLKGDKWGRDWRIERRELDRWLSTR